MLSNPRTVGMAAEDGPWFGALSVPDDCVVQGGGARDCCYAHDNTSGAPLGDHAKTATHRD